MKKPPVKKKPKGRKPKVARAVRLYRAGKPPVITQAMLRADGVHFIDHDGRENSGVAYRTLAAMNGAMRRCGYGTFSTVKPPL